MAKPLVLLCNPPSPPDGMADREFAFGMGRVGTLSERAIPPHTLAWTAAALQHAGWQVVAVDAVASRLNNAQTISAILNHRPGVLILLVSPATAAADCEFIHALRLHVTSLPILLVGLGARHLPANLIREANMVLAGEPEGVADVACDFLLANKGRVGLVSPQALNVPAYDAVGRLVDLDSLPLPAWDLFPMRSYDRLPIVSSRGCNRGCRYCPVPVTQGTIFRALAAERVVEEMRLINSCYRVQRFQFLDPLWTADHEHAEALCNALIQSGLSRRIQWSCETRADLLDLFLLDRMAKAGCRELHLGLESVAPDALVALGRLASPQDAPEYLRRFQQVVRACRTLNIASHVHVIEGVPGDEGGTEAARTFLRTCPPDALHVTPLLLHPGTSLLPTSPLPFEQPEQEVLAGSLDQPPTKTSGWWRVVGRLRSLPSA